MDCSYYDFTIEDDVFKTTSDSVSNPSFSPNTTYLAYAALKIGFDYRETGPLGTDLYITNLKLYDITDNKVYKVGKDGIIKATEFVSGRRNQARLQNFGVMSATDIIEN